MDYKLGHEFIPPISPWAKYHGSRRTALIVNGLLSKFNSFWTALKPEKTFGKFMKKIPEKTVFNTNEPALVKFNNCRLNF